MSVLIDPYMFELEEEHEIKRNVGFFKMLITMCNHPDPRNRIPIILYKGILDRMNRRELQPFPIKIDKISDLDLKQTLLQINHSFNNAMLNYIEMVEFDGCSGEQLFSVVKDDEEDLAFKEDEHYFEMLYTLLIPCYKKEISIDHRIVTGEKQSGKQIGDSFSLNCSCVDNEHKEAYVFARIDDFIPLQEKLIEKLKRMKKESQLQFVEQVPASTNGDHHVHVCDGGRHFSLLSHLSLKSRKVLQQLRYLGLYEIKFGDFRPEPGKIVGNMTLIDLEERDTADILNVRFFAETGFTITTALYFPKGIGKITYDYFCDEKKQLTYQNVSKLVERIK